MDEQLHRQKGRVHKEVEQQGKRVRAAWVRRVRRPVHLLWQALQLRAQLTVTYRMESTEIRMTLRRVPAVDKVVKDPSAQGQGLGREHGICKELQGRAELQRKAMARRLLRKVAGQCMGVRRKWQWMATHQVKCKVMASLPRMESRQGHSSMVALQCHHCMEQQAACLRTAVDAWWWMVRMEEAREESGPAVRREHAPKLSVAMATIRYILLRFVQVQRREKIRARLRGG